MEELSIMLQLLRVSGCPAQYNLENFRIVSFYYDSQKVNALGVYPCASTAWDYGGANDHSP